MFATPRILRPVFIRASMFFFHIFRVVFDRSGYFDSLQKVVGNTTGTFNHFCRISPLFLFFIQQHDQRTETLLEDIPILHLTFSHVIGYNNGIITARTMDFDKNVRVHHILSKLRNFQLHSRRWSAVRKLCFQTKKSPPLKVL